MNQSLPPARCHGFGFRFFVFYKRSDKHLSYYSNLWRPKNSHINWNLNNSLTYEESCCIATGFDSLDAVGLHTIVTTKKKQQLRHPRPHYGVVNALCKPMMLKNTRNSTVFPYYLLEKVKLEGG